MDGDNVTSGGNQQETPTVRLLDPNWVCGFVDGEGCFSVPLRKNPMARHGWQIQPTFQVSQHCSNRAVLDALVEFFGCGSVRSKGPQSTVDVFNVWRRCDLEERVLPVFERYVLQVKAGDYRRFGIIVRSLNRKRHLDRRNFERLVQLAYGMNANGKQRSRPIGDIVDGSSETVRRAR
jgi:hypothetical protein